MYPLTIVQQQVRDIKRQARLFAWVHFLLRIHKVQVMTQTLCDAAVRDGFQWLEPEKYGISVTPYYYAASDHVYPLTLEQLHAKSAADLEFDLSQDPNAPGLSLEVCTTCPFLWTACLIVVYL